MSAHPLPDDPHARDVLREASARARRNLIMLAAGGVAVLVGMSSPVVTRWAATPGAAWVVWGVKRLAASVAVFGGTFAVYLWLQGQGARFQHFPNALHRKVRIIAWSVVGVIVLITALAIWYTTSQGLTRWK